MTAAVWNNETPAANSTDLPPVDGKEYVDPAATNEDRQWGMWTHLGPLLATVVTSGTLAPLGVAWGLYVTYVPGKERPFVADHGREMFNFALSYLLYSIVGTILVAIFTLGFGLLLFAPFLLIYGLVCTIMASVAAAKGRYYRYPMCIRFLKAPHENGPPAGQAG